MSGKRLLRQALLALCCVTVCVPALAGSDPRTIETAIGYVEGMREHGASNDDIARWLSGVVDRRLSATNRIVGSNDSYGLFIPGATEAVGGAPSEWSARFDRFRSERETLGRPAGYFQRSDITERALWAWENQVGNCNEAQAVAYHILTQAGIPAVPVQSNAGSGHDFVVIGLTPNDDVNRPETWGRDARVVDGWTGTALTPDEARHSSHHSDEGHAQLIDRTRAITNPEQELRWIEMAGKGNLQVTAVDQGGHPVDGVAVRMSAGGQAFFATTSNGGRATVTVPVGPVMIELIPPPATGLAGTTATVTVAERQLVEPRITLAPAVPVKYSVYITVRNLFQPLEVVEVTVTREGQTERYLTTDYGEVSFSLPTGRWSVRATKTGYFPSTTVIEVKEPGVNVTIQMNKVSGGGTVRVMDDNGWLHGVGVNVSRDRESRTVRTGVDGYAHFPELEPGVWTVTASAEGHEDASDVLEIVVGAERGLVLLLATKPGTLAVTILGNGGAPVAGARVAVPGVGTAVTGSDGRAVLAAVPVGRWDGAVSASGYDAQTFTAIVPAGGEGAVTVTLTPQLVPASVRVGGGTAWLAGAVVTITRDGEQCDGVTDEAGWASWSVMAGEWTASASHPGFTGATDQLTVEPGRGGSVVLILEPIGGSLVVTVVGGKDRPIPGATVTVTGAGSATTDGAGQARFAGVPAGAVTGTVGAADYLDQGFGATIETERENAVTVRLPRSGAAPLVTADTRASSAGDTRAGTGADTRTQPPRPPARESSLFGTGKIEYPFEVTGGARVAEKDGGIELAILLDREHGTIEGTVNGLVTVTIVSADVRMMQHASMYGNFNGPFTRTGEGTGRFNLPVTIIEEGYSATGTASGTLANGVVTCTVAVGGHRLVFRVPVQ